MKSTSRFYYLSALVGLIIVIALVLGIRAYRQDKFVKTASGLEYSVVHKGTGPHPQEGEVMVLDMSYGIEKGRVLQDTADQDLPMAIPYTKNEEAKEGGFEEAIGMLQKGDDIKFRLTAATLFGEYVDLIATQHGIEKDTKMILSLHLRDVMTEEAYKQWETKQIAMLQKQQQEKAEQQHQEDAKTIADYLKKNEIVAQTTASGLHYVIDTPGQGASPQSGAQVKVNYTGRLLDGKVFDTSLEAMAKEHQVHNPQRTYAPLEFKVGMGQVIQGWDEGILLLNKGAKARFFIPSTLAYGSRAMGDVIPANAILTFEVELVDF